MANIGSKYPPFNTARQHAHELAFKSSVQYLKWHKENNPAYLPRYPNRVYTKEFVSWNDFLGTQNSFNQNHSKQWRPYWEAVKWSQKNAAEHNINTGPEWLAWCKNSGKLPEDIPQTPESVYDEFRGNGWSVWLGQDVRAKLIAASVITHLFVICSNGNLAIPGNYYNIIHAPTGEKELKDKLAEHRDMKVYRGYKWDPEQAETVSKLIDAMGTNMGEGMYFFPNLNALLFELDSILEWVNIKKTDIEIVISEQKQYEIMFPDAAYKHKV